MLELQDYNAAVRKIADDTYALVGSYLDGCKYVTEPHLREIGGCYLEHRGKCLRPALLTFCCQAAGGDGNVSRHAAAAVEMFHTWTLMHDDIIDHDDVRRGCPAAHVRGSLLGAGDLALEHDLAGEYGQCLAILGGDLLHGLAADMLMASECRPAVALGLARRMNAKLCPELLSGEQLDVRLSHVQWRQITEEAIMEMMRLKTGALLAFCAEAGVALGEGRLPEDSAMANDLASFAHLCGLAFQMKDDILGVFGDETKFGKPIGSDIREGKRTVLMLKTFENSSPASCQCLMEMLGRADADEEEIAKAREIVSASGAAKAVEKMSDDYVEQALNILKRTVPDGMASGLLERWALSMVARNK